MGWGALLLRSYGPQPSMGSADLSLDFFIKFKGRFSPENGRDYCFAAMGPHPVCVGGRGRDGLAFLCFSNNTFTFK